MSAPERPPINKDEVEDLRRLFFDKYSADEGGGIFDDRDIDRVRADDNYLHGFLMIGKMNKQDALTKMVDALKWRKEWGINDLTFEAFPDWALQIGGLYSRGKDKVGRKILWFKVATHKKDASRAEWVKKYIAFWLDKLHKENPGENIVLVEDMTNAGLANMDMDVIGFLIKCLELRFPAVVGMLYVYNMPWYLNAIWKIIEKLLSEESKAHIKFLFGDDVQQYVSKDHLPPHMGGTDTYQWVWPPPDNEDSVEEISILQNTMDETFEQASDNLSSPAPSDSPPDSPPGGSGDIVNGTEAVTNGDVRIPPKNQVVKKVTFSPDTEDNENRDHSMLSTSSTLSRLKQRKSAKKSKIKDVARGPLLTIRPGEQLTFNPAPVRDEDPSTVDPSLVLSLTNTTDKKIAYKVKTTTPDRYRVRPSAGPINPGASINITITLLSGNQEEVAKDKFLILSTELGEVIRTPAELSNYWRRVPRGNIVEHRMRCQYNLPSIQEMEFKWIREHMLAMSKNLETVKAHSASLESRTYRLQMILRIQLFCIFVLTLVCGMWLMGWIDVDGVEGVCPAGQQSNAAEHYTKVFNHTPV
ncbi:motile sperm domain-containing protein 2-like [Amphiura filiformis]|uniref:motile sperm domain-containing protein 2-like n=1 Tax=Amphiura filiformis TaxID=82378 RepID=UPI003B2226FD